MGCASSRYASDEYDISPNMRMRTKMGNSRKINAVKSTGSGSGSFYANRMIFSDQDFIFKDCCIATIQTNAYDTIQANRLYSLTNIPTQGDDAVI
jgi:hypothetical protein